MRINQITEKIIGCAIEAHKRLGPGLLESSYEECLSYQLKCAGLAFERQVPVPVVYKDIKLECGYRVVIFKSKKQSNKLNIEYRLTNNDLRSRKLFNETNYIKLRRE